MTTDNSIRSMFDVWMAEHAGDPDKPPIPAATVILVRDGEHGLEVLMMHRASTVAFGGAWVFPGGKLDPEDYDAADPDDVLAASRTAAVREAMEEGGITVEVDELVEHSHWMPPAVAPKRFATWFFIAPATEEDVVVDQGEITEHAWMRPTDAIEQHIERKIELAPPTWVTLHGLTEYSTAADAITATDAKTPQFYVTRIGRLDDDPVAMWHADVAYESGDMTAEGDRHRLVMQRGAWRFEHATS